MKKNILFCVSFVVAFSLDLTNLQADFMQKITNEQNKTIIYKGVVFVGKTKILWAYKTPVLKKVLFTKKQIYILEPELEQLTIAKNANVKLLDLESIYKNAKIISKNTRQAVVDNRKVTIKNNAKFVTKISYKDEIGNDVELLFLNTKPKNYGSDFFKLEAPKDYDIISD